MRVLVVMSKFVAGGAETTALRLIDAMQGRGGYEFVAAAVKGGGELTGQLRRTGAVIYDGIARFRGDPVGLWRMARIIRRHRIDVIVCVGPLICKTPLTRRRCWVRAMLARAGSSISSIWCVPKVPTLAAVLLQRLKAAFESQVSSSVENLLLTARLITFAGLAEYLDVLWPRSRVLAREGSGLEQGPDVLSCDSLFRA